LQLNDLIEIKLRSVKVFGNVTCREEDAAALLPCVKGSTGSPRTTILPAGFELMDNRLFLDSASNRYSTYAPLLWVWFLEQVRVGQNRPSFGGPKAK
jgi:hypothetical protein